MEYIRATVQVGPCLYRVYAHHGARINIGELYMFFENNETHQRQIDAFECSNDFHSALPQIINVVAVDEFDIDDPLKVIMIDESGIYFW